MKLEIVVPCYNEAARLTSDAVAGLIERDDVNVLLVNDGSTDDTWELVRRIRSELGDRVEVLGLMSNLGKAEAVRRGLVRAIEKGADAVGYLDADFSTPPDEMLRLVDIFDEDEDIKVLLGSRWLHMGANIVRSDFRHYTGRVFATIASNILRMRIYDTQCGAKLFRVTAGLKAALKEPFLSRWAFDVELIGRLHEGVAGETGYALSRFREVPLGTWIDVKGTKLRWRDMFTVAIETIAIARYLRGIRRRNEG